MAGIKAFELPYGITEYTSDKKYVVTKLGDVYFGNNKEGYAKINTYLKKGKRYVMIYDKEYYLPEVLLHISVGKIDLPIKCKCEELPTMKDVYYEIPQNVQLQFLRKPLKDSYYIANILFKSIPGSDEYFISNTGIVYSSRKCNFVNHRLSSDCYHIVTVVVNGEPCTRAVHRLVYLTFVGNIPEGYEIDHKYSRSMNGINDIELVTHIENIRRAHKAGCYSDHTYEDVIDICEKLQEGYQVYEIANLRGLYKGHPDYDRFLSFCYHIRNKECWRDITEKYNFPPTRIGGGRVYEPETIHEICRLMIKGYSQRDIAKMLNLPYRQYISQIRNGQVWKNISSQYDFSKCRKRGGQSKDLKI